MENLKIKRSQFGIYSTVRGIWFNLKMCPTVSRSLKRKWRVPRETFWSSLPAVYIRVPRDTSESRGIRASLAGYERLSRDTRDYRGTRSTTGGYDRLPRYTSDSRSVPANLSGHNRLPRYTDDSRGTHATHTASPGVETRSHVKLQNIYVYEYLLSIS